MDDPRLLALAVLASVVVIGFLLYRTRAKAKISVPGIKVEFDGSNDSGGPPGVNVTNVQTGTSAGNEPVWRAPQSER